MTDIPTLVREHGLKPSAPILSLARAAYEAGVADATPPPRRTKRGSPPYGSEPAEAEVVRSILAARDAGQTLAAIAGMLDADEISPPRGDRWSLETVRRIIARSQPET